MIRIKKLNIKFKDKNNNLCNIDCKLSSDDKFSISGECNRHYGQCLDEINPLTKNQKRLIEIWRNYHLNDMNAGTPKQTELLNQMQDKYEYDLALQFLDSYDNDLNPISAFNLIKINQERTKVKEKLTILNSELFIINEEKIKQKSYNNGRDYWVIIKELNIKECKHTYTDTLQYFKKLILKKEIEIKKQTELLNEVNNMTMKYDYGIDNKLYKYGATWHKNKLPVDLFKELKNIKIEIEKFNIENKNDGGEWSDITDNKIITLAKYLNISPNEAIEDITTTIKNEIYTYCGIEYYVLTENEANILAEQQIDTDYWKIAIENNNTQLGFNDCKKDVIKTDGFSHILNGRDGSKHFDKENNLFIMRC